MSDGRNIGLMAVECQDVLFEDIMRRRVLAGSSSFTVEIDPVFAACCEPGSLRVTDVLPDMALPGLTVELQPDLLLRVRMPAQAREVQLVITIHGVRRGHAEARQRVWTPAQASRNAAFYAQFHAA